MLVMVPGGELAGLAAGYVHRENVEAFVVVEMRISFPGIGLVEVARDHNGVARRVGGFRARLRRNEGDPLRIGRPCNALAGGGQRTVRAFQRRQQLLA